MQAEVLAVSKLGPLDPQSNGADCPGSRQPRRIGYWQQVATYVTAHSHAVFSHGICPECMNTHVPEDAAGEHVTAAASSLPGSGIHLDR